MTQKIDTPASVKTIMEAEMWKMQINRLMLIVALSIYTQVASAGSINIYVLSQSATQRESTIIDPCDYVKCSDS